MFEFLSYHKPFSLFEKSHTLPYTHILSLQSNHKRKGGEIRLEILKKMGRGLIISCLLILGLALCSGTKSKLNYELSRMQQQKSIYTKQTDITTPITTVPIITPANPGPRLPVMGNPVIGSATLPPSSGSVAGSWCVASQGASQMALQVALDYACGYGGADCSAIQAGGGCYSPNTLRDHASFAFNSYYQKNPVPNSCNFGGTAVTTSTNPSSGLCQYPSTSTSSSVLNTTNSNGGTVFGKGPSNPSSLASPLKWSAYKFSSTLLLLFLVGVYI